MMRSCRVFGLGIEYDAPLAALAALPPAERIDVTCRLGTMPPDADGAEWLPHGTGPSALPVQEATVRAFRRRDGSGYRLDYADGTRFVVASDGSALWATWPSGATVEDTATYLLGPVLGFVLRLRGIACLHASAVAVDGKAIAIASHSGGGKSSTAAAFAGLGYAVLSDDVAALGRDGRGMVLHPAYPRVRLWPEAVEAMFGSPDALPPIAPPWPKRGLPLGGAQAPFQPEALPLGVVYVLDDRRDDAIPALEALAPREALVWLVGHSYVTYLLDKGMRAREFDFLARLVEAVDVVRVSPPADISRIGALCEHIASDARARFAPVPAPRRASL